MTQLAGATASLALALFGLSGCATPSQPQPTTVVIRPGAQITYVKYHYAPAIRVGDTVIVSGIPAARGSTYEQKIRNMFQRAQNTLESAGTNFDDVVEVTTFRQNAPDTAAFAAEFASFIEIQKEFFTDHYPAWTAVGVTSLLAPGAPVEMRLVAVVGSGKHVVLSPCQPDRNSAACTAVTRLTP
jgi:enamine deaminase RidA (YjgF/YER057c/UK114 family)